MPIMLQAWMKSTSIRLNLMLVSCPNLFIQGGAFATRGAPRSASLDIKLLRAHANTGRPLGEEAFLATLEQDLGRILRRQKPGPKRRPQSQVGHLRNPARSEDRHGCPPIPVPGATAAGVQMESAVTAAAAPALTIPVEMVTPAPAEMVGPGAAAPPREQD